MIRQARAKDVPVLMALYQSEGWLSFTEDKVIKLMANSTYLVAEQDSALVGFIRFLTDGEMTTFVSELLVEKSVRHQGIGKELLAAVAQSSPSTRLELISENDDFYSHNDFRKVGTGFRK